MKKRIAVSLWNLKSSFYHSIRSFPFLRKIVHREIKSLEILLETASLNPIKVLDVGVGLGSTLSIFSKPVRIIGLDRSFKMVQKSREREKVIGVVGDVLDLPFKSHAVPFVSVIGLVEYFQDKKMLLKEINRIICSNGHFLVTIAPTGLFNFLRNLFGHRIYPIRVSGWETMVSQKGFVCIGKVKTWLQNQYLYLKKEAPIF